MSGKTFWQQSQSKSLNSTKLTRPVGILSMEPVQCQSPLAGLTHRMYGSRPQAILGSASRTDLTIPPKTNGAWDPINRLPLTKKGRRADYTETSRLNQVAFDGQPVGVSFECLLKRRQIQRESLRVCEKIGPLQFCLILKQEMRHLPELPLLACRDGRFMRQRGVGI